MSFPILSPATVLHTHTFCAHTHTLCLRTHTLCAYTQTLSLLCLHTHSVPTHIQTLCPHTHSLCLHTLSVSTHTHSVLHVHYAADAAKLLQLCLTLCDPRDGSPQAPQSLGFSRQEHWSGLPFPSPMHESEK